VRDDAHGIGTVSEGLAQGVKQRVNGLRRLRVCVGGCRGNEASSEMLNRVLVT